MPTERLFDINAYDTEFDARIIGSKSENGENWVLLDRTLFFPEGGGQYPDIGTIGGYDVLDVQEDRDGLIWHRVTGIPETECIHGEIDFSRRFDFMQQHSGEHIFSGIAHEHYVATNVGFHLGLDFTTIDLDVPLTEKDVDFIEEKANRAVYENVPFVISYPSPEELKSIPYRSKKELSGRVRIVTVPGYDICACCGTHVRTAGEIGIIKITSFQNYKGGTRLTLLCGGRAYTDYRNKNRDVSKVTVGLSVKPEELCEAVDRLEKDITDRKIYESQLKKELFSLKADAAGSGPFAVRFESGLTPDEARQFCLALSAKCGIAFVFSGGGNDWKYSVSSGSADCRNYAAKLNAAFSGRGGGKPELCMGGLSGSKQEIESFIENILNTEEQHDKV